MGRKIVDTYIFPDILCVNPWSRLLAFVEGGYHHLHHIVMLVKYVAKEGMVPSVFLYMFVEIAALNEGHFTHSAFIWVIAGMVRKMLIHVRLLVESISTVLTMLC